MLASRAVLGLDHESHFLKNGDNEAAQKLGALGVLCGFYNQRRNFVSFEYVAF
jgi:hypothetical protein